MKKIFCILFALLPLLAVAKDDKKDDNMNPKYLAGAVTMTDGKVVFSQEVQVPSLSKDVIYSKLLNWADKRFQPKDKLHSKVVYKNQPEGQISAAGEEYLVFSSSAFSLDRTRIYYQFSILAYEGSFKLIMERIRYWYDENREGGERYKAEEWITDDMALNKKKTKLGPICGKFRRETINLKDELFQSAISAVSTVSLAENPQPQTNSTVQTVTTNTTTATVNQTGSTPVQTTVTKTTVQTIPATPVQATAMKKELAEISLNQLPANLNEIAASGRMTITAGEEEIEVKPETWGGFGKLLNKDVAYTLIDKSRMAVSLIMEHSDTYKISFYPAGSAEPVVVIDCKKSMKQDLTSEELKSLNQQIDTNKKYAMYIGVITRCMMR